MALVKHNSYIFRSLLTITALFGLLFAAVHYMNLSFTLDGARRILAEQIQTYTGRDVRIDGEVELTISLFPRLLVQRIHIRNHDDFNDEDFITIDEARVEVQLLPLLSGQLHLSDISADEAKINLLQKKDGSHNWSFDNAAQASKPADTKTADPDSKSGMSRFSVGVFQLTNVTIKYSDESRDQVIEKHLDQLLIDLNDKTEPRAEISGKVQGHPYAITFKSDALEVLPSGKPWLLHGTGHITDSQTDLKANVLLKNNEIISNVNITVENVNLGLLLDELGLISGQDALTEKIHIKAKLHGSNLAELYELAEISLLLDKGYWTLQSAETGQKQKLLFTKASSFTSWNKPVELHVDGELADKAIKIDFKTNRLFEFFDETKKLDVDLKANFADSYASMKGALDLPIKTKQFNLDITLNVKNLGKLNSIINADFPPFNDMSLSGNLIANTKGFVLKSAKVAIGDSQFQSSIVIQTNTAKPTWIISLYSQQIQLDDFLFDDWNIEQPNTAAEKDSKQRYDERNALRLLRQLENLARNPRSNFDLNVKLDKVFSGETLLGKARYQFHLRDNAINLNNVDTEIPGGRITGSVSFEIEDDEVTGHATLNIDKLDYGITTRLFDPKSEIDGVISANVDLQLRGSDITRVLNKATGQIDIAVWPKNTKPARALNLWATNLYLILLPELKKKESLVNCMVGLMDMDEGKMKEELFAIDTTQLWIYGNINVDFEQEYVELSLFPQSKTARLFSLQTPIRAQGSFTDFGLLLNPIDLTETYISFITSPLHVPARRIFGDKISKDGSSICEQLFDREYVKNLKAETEKKEQKEIDSILEDY